MFCRQRRHNVHIHIEAAAAAQADRAVRQRSPLRRIRVREAREEAPGQAALRLRGGVCARQARSATAAGQQQRRRRRCCSSSTMPAADPHGPVRDGPGAVCHDRARSPPLPARLSPAGLLHARLDRGPSGPVRELRHRATSLPRAVHGRRAARPERARAHRRLYAGHAPLQPDEHQREAQDRPELDSDLRESALPEYREQPDGGAQAERGDAHVHVQAYASIQPDRGHSRSEEEQVPH